MLKLKKIAITGGLSCGKSSVCHFFKELGSYTISADEIVHQLLFFNTKLIQEIVNLLGSDIIENHQVVRSRIAKKVFNNPQLLRSLEKTIHPLVYEEIDKHYRRVFQERRAQLFIVEIPLLFENGGDQFFDKTIVVTADPAQCQARFQKKTNYEPAEFDKRSARMMNLNEKALKADFVIVNDGSLEELQQKVKKIYYDLLEQ